MKKPYTVAISGLKNSGKTRLITRLIPELNKRGMKVAVIKHDGHDFTCDIEGTDSFEFINSGAYGTAVFSDKRMFAHKVGTGETERDLIAMFPEADIILLEGFKDSSYPKIEVIRDGCDVCPVSNPKGRFLIVSEMTDIDFDEPCLGSDDIVEIADEIMRQKSK